MSDHGETLDRPRDGAQRGHHSRSLRYGTAVALSCIVLLGAGLRWLARGDALEWNSDEGITYLMATCHGTAFAEAVEVGSVDFGRWVSASNWQRLIDSDRFCPGVVRHDLSVSDVHPPLYFWLLNAWTTIFGRSLAAGMALNALCAAVGLVFLYLLARRALPTAWEAMAVVALSALDLRAIQASLEFRPYALLACVSLGYCWASALGRSDPVALARNDPPPDRDRGVGGAVR